MEEEARREVFAAMLSDPGVRRLVEVELERTLAPKELLKIVGQLEERITSLEREIDELRKASGSTRNQGLKYRIGMVDLLQLPDHLRKTMITLSEVNQATASELAEKTGRVRNLESSYLNQLERMGLIERFRKGRKIHFRARYVRGPGVRRVLEQLRR